ncbi:MAG: heme-binding domain-containing protein [bacterium]|nr:heme-binding domain-containing protein [bacterium]
MMARVLPVAGALLVLFTIIQFVPVQKGNPPSGTEIDAPLEVKEVFRRACYDCHSTETLWPWYSSVAPASWLVAHDVREGREKVNFTAWKVMSFEPEAEVIDEIWEEIENGTMPPWFYRWAHKQSRINDGEKP